jgi:diguanylate cyclase (GGDEF)-like protein
LGQREELDLNAQLVDHDALTGLLNRRGVFDVLSGAVARQEIGCLLLVDLDDFKLVNDHHGHGVGDHVLQVVSDRLRASIRPSDAAGRLSGDEFVVLLRDIDLGGALEVAERTIGHIEQVIAIPHASVSISASVGVATIAGQPSVLALIQAADAAMYAAKTAGRGQALAAVENQASPRVSTNDVTVTPEHASAFGLADIDTAITVLGVLFQPIVDAFTLQVTGLEALTRGPVGPLENPAALFRIAETWGRLTELELAAKRLTFATPVPADVTLYVNIDPAALTSPGFLESLIDEWSNSPNAGRDLVVELTERHLRSQPGRLLHAVEQCRSAGWKVALDDVGARAESLTALGFVEPDVIKLDMALINTTNPWHLAATTVALASYCEHRAVEVIAEGIEHEDQARVAIELGATHLQGFLYGRPAAITDISTSADRPPRQPSGATVVRPAQRRAHRRQLLAISRHIEGLANHTDTVILAALQHVENYSPLTSAQYTALARRCGTVGIVAAGASPGVRHGVHHGTIQLDDDLVNCWQVVLVHPEGGVALLARQADPGSNAWYDYEITTDRSRVNAAARRLLRQL